MYAYLTLSTYTVKIALQKRTESIILEYYEHGDTNEAAMAFEDFLTDVSRPKVHTYLQINKFSVYNVFIL